MQTEVGRRLGVHRGSVQNWELGVTQPGICHLPAIIEFLGYDPEPEPKSLPERIAYSRRRLGFTQDDLANVLRLDPVTIWRWEAGRTQPPKTCLQELQSLLNQHHIRLGLI